MYLGLLDKRTIRKEALSRRDSIDFEVKQVKDKKIRERLLALPEFTAAHAVLLYASFRSEVSTFALIQWVLSQNKIAVLPKVVSGCRELALYKVRDLGELAAGYHGIPEPSLPDDRRMDLEAVGLLVVPGVAFDDRCNRLGYGGGYYDRLLSRKKAPAFALSYEEQIFSSVPSDTHDIKMDKIITDMRIIGCHEQ